MEWLNVLRSAVLIVAPIGFLYQRDLPFTYLVSVDNTTWFIAYWLFIPMVIWYAIEKYEEDSPSSISSNLKGRGRSREQMNESRKKNISEREYAVQREREFIKEEVAKSKARDKRASNSTEDKLKKLKDLYDKELISKEVYEKQQLEILSE